MTCYFSNYHHTYRGLRTSKKEQMFGLSALHPEHQEAGDFPVSNQDVEREIRNELTTMIGRARWREISEGRQDHMIHEFQDGDAINWILKWHLEDVYDQYACVTESGGSQSEYDVMIKDSGVPFCGIEIKRAGSSKRIKNYLEDIPNKKDDRPDVRKYLLLILFPISKFMDMSRTYYLVRGYGPLSAYYNELYTDSLVHVEAIPTPIYPLDDSSIGPLRIISETLRKELDITG